MQTTEQQDEARRTIKAASIQELEQAFAKALSDLVGERYNVTVNKLDFVSGINSLFDQANLEITASRRIDGPF